MLKNFNNEHSLLNKYKHQPYTSYGVQQKENTPILVLVNLQINYKVNQTRENMKRKAAMHPSEDNSAHLEGVVGALGCVWKGPDLE